MKKPSLSANTIFIFVSCFYLLVSCQPETDIIETIVPTRPIQITTTSIEQTPLPIATINFELTVTLPPTRPPISPTATLEPTVHPVPTSPPTPSPWLIDDWSPFWLYSYNNLIYLSRPGQPLQPLGPGITLFGQPWSPDGTKFVFYPPTQPFSTNTTLTVADLKTGQTTDVHISKTDSPPNVYWSPDGKYLLYLAYWQGSAKITLLDIEKKQNQIVTDKLNIYNSGNWSPDGSKFSMVLQVNEQYDIYTFDIHTFALEQVTNTPEVELTALWSPIKNELLVSSVPSGTPAIYHFPTAWDIYLLDIETKMITPLFPRTYFPLSPKPIIWSPDGSAINYVKNNELCVLTIETQSSKCLTTIPESLIVTDQPTTAWSSDNKFLIFTGTNPNQDGLCYTLFLANFITQNIQPIDLSQCVHSFAYSWSPFKP